jgi:hypothetical protein
LVKQVGTVKNRGSDDVDKVGLAERNSVFSYIKENFAAFMAADFDDKVSMKEFNEGRSQPGKVQDLIKA